MVLLHLALHGNRENVFRLTSDAQAYAVAIPAHYCPTRRPPPLYGNTNRTDYVGKHRVEHVDN